MVGPPTAGSELFQWRCPRAATVSRAWCDGPRVLRDCCPPGTRSPLRRDHGHEWSDDRMRLVRSPSLGLCENPGTLGYSLEFPRMKLPTEECCPPDGRSPHCSSRTGVRHVRPPRPAPTESASPR